MSKKRLDMMMEAMNARLDEMEHRTRVEKKACDLIAQGKDEVAIALLNTLDDSLLYRKRDFTDFEQAQEAIYKELPMAVEKVFHAAFMNCSIGAQMPTEEDWDFIEPFVEEMTRIFNLTVKEQINFLRRIWKCEQKECERGGSGRHNLFRMDSNEKKPQCDEEDD